MRYHVIANLWPSRFPLSLACFLFVLVTLVSDIAAQSCPALDSSPTNRAKFKQGNKVYWQFHTSVPTSGSQRSQIRDAFTAWHNANELNCSKVQFIEGTAPSGFGYATLTVKDLIINSNYVVLGGGAADFDSAGGVNSLNEITSATLSFNHDLRYSQANPIKLYDPAYGGYSKVFHKQAMHEIGHGMGLNHISGDPCNNTLKGTSVMFPACDINDYGDAISETVTSCDITSINARYICPTPTPPPSPSPTPDPPSGCSNWMYNTFQGGVCPMGFTSGGTSDWYCCEDCVYQGQEWFWDPSGYGELDCSLCQDGVDNDCNGLTDFADSNCYDCNSPIVIDTLGDGFDLTSTDEGANFDLSGVGSSRRVSWTQGDDAWLVLDRNGNGSIDSGKELFGGVTWQLSSPKRNGFKALAEFDKLGNSDGKIDSSDQVFAALRLWKDNGDGVSEPSELYTLAEMGISRIDLDYKESGRVDEHGNEFKYRAKVHSSNGTTLGRWAYDVYLKGAPTDSVGLLSERQSLLAFRSLQRPLCSKRWKA